MTPYRCRQTSRASGLTLFLVCSTATANFTNGKSRPRTVLTPLRRPRKPSCAKGFSAGTNGSLATYCNKKQNKRTRFLCRYTFKMPFELYSTPVLSEGESYLFLISICTASFPSKKDRDYNHPNKRRDSPRNYGTECKRASILVTLLVRDRY